MTLAVLCATTFSTLTFIFIVPSVGDKLNYTNISVFGSLHLYNKEENSPIKWRQDDVEDSLGPF